VLWTILPVLILVMIAIPSFRLLFRQFDFPKADVVVKATGKQWYWSYEYPDAKISFDSFPIEEKDLKPGQLRNLSVDNEMVVPVEKVVQVLITGGDVIHQWVVPSFGSRADGIPGRINRTWFVAKERGVYYGECSALCGQGHPYMPIAVRVVSEDEYKRWVGEKQKSASLDKNRTAAADPMAAAER
jgi:cytochrome c oxidase subunit II